VAEYETLIVERRDGIGYLILNRPESANTISVQLTRELHQALDELADDRSVRVVILTGAGDRHFCAGADLKEGVKFLTGDAEPPFMAHPTSKIEEMPQPVIAVINGAALGGGCEISLACDFRFMADTAVIGLPEIVFGMLPAWGGTQRLPRVVGLAKAKEILFTGRPLSAEEALEVGLVTAIAPPEKVMAEAEAFAQGLAEKADYALAAMKLVVNTAQEVDLERGLRLERQVALTMGSPERRMAALERAMAGSPIYKNLFSGR
jgi:methylglutaconyl-CoA hydratase